MVHIYIQLIKLYLSICLCIYDVKHFIIEKEQDLDQSEPLIKLYDMGYMSNPL